MHHIAQLYFSVFFLVLCAKATPDARTLRRVVAVGDIHGDSEKFQRIIKLSQVFLEDEKEIERQRPSTTFIQMGDLVDRGEDDIECLNIAFSMCEKAASSDAQDKAVFLLGNHELLNLQGFFHYVNPHNFGGFGSKELRKLAFEGPYGKFIVSNFMTAHIQENTLFVHAGFDSDLNYYQLSTIDSLNVAVRDALQRREYDDRWLSSRGPLWTRKMVLDAIDGDCQQIDAACKHFGVERIVVGHTPERSGHIGVYCRNRLITVDVGISRWMYDHFAYLEILVTERTECSEKILVETSLWEVGDNYRKLIVPMSSKLESPLDTQDL